MGGLERTPPRFSSLRPSLTSRPPTTSFSGDIGYQDHEGFFYILDRAKDIIIR